MNGARSRSRACAAAVVAALLAGGSFACRGDAVIIGIEGDGGVPTPLGTHVPVSQQPPPDIEEEAGLIEPSTFDASLTPCFPDAGCAGASLCEYLLDAGCGAPGVCVPKVAVPPPPPPPPGDLVFRGTPEYSLTPILCDAGAPPGDATANDGDAFAADARED